MSESFGGLPNLEDTADARLLARLRETEAQLQEARQGVRAKSELLATVSHEIRTPIGAIISMADLLAGRTLDETQRYYAETLKQSANSLLKILNDVLDHSKLEVGRFSLSVAQFDPHSLLFSVESVLAARCAGKGVDIVAEGDPRVPAHLVGDADRIRQILMNLCDNAVKFTEHGSIVITMIHRENADGSPQLAFSVKDTGIGMSAEAKTKLFAPYIQADKTIASKYGGTGLGLSISRKLVDLMGGDIGCESREGSGSTFWFSIDCQHCAADAKPSGEALPGATPASGRHAAGKPVPAHILVVEDKAINQMLITTYLDKFGHTFEITSNGKEAVAAASAKVYDLILMDVQMPEMDGIQATRLIRALEGPAGTQPIVALTANAMHGDRENYLEAGMNDYLAKPIIAANLLEMLNRMLPGLADAVESRTA